MEIHLTVIVQQLLMKHKQFCWAYSHLTSILFSVEEKTCIENCHVNLELEMEKHRLLVAGARPACQVTLFLEQAGKTQSWDAAWKDA